MRILIVTSFIPYPPDSGARIRTWEIARRLRRDHEVVFGLHLRAQSDLDRVNAIREHGFEVIAGWVDKGWRAAVTFVTETLSGAPPLFALRRSRDLEIQLARLHAAKPFDVVQIEHFEIARYGRFIGLSDRVVLSMVLHDILSVSYARIAAIETNPFWKLWRRYNANRFKAYERKLLPDFDVCVTVSEKDRQKISSYVQPGKIQLLPNCVDSDAKVFLEEPAPAPPVLLFVGLLLYPPNADAVRWLIEEILPRIRSSHSDCRLKVIGDDPPQFLRNLVQANQATVTLAGRVEELEPCYTECQVAVVPLRAGGGTRLKILEAMAFGRPVVSTTLGAEGLRVKNCEHLLIADTAEDFAQAVVRLFRSANLRQHLRQNARSLVEKEYAWDQCANAHSSMYNKMGPKKSYGRPT